MLGNVLAMDVATDGSARVCVWTIGGNQYTIWFPAGATVAGVRLRFQIVPGTEPERRGR